MCAERKQQVGGRRVAPARLVRALDPEWRAEALQPLGAASPEGVVSSATPGVMAAEGPEGPHKGRVGVVDGPRSPQSQTPGAVWHSASTGSRHLGWLCSLGLGLFPAAVSWP